MTGATNRALSGTGTEEVPPDEPAIRPVRARFRPTREAEGRLLLLIDAFSRKANGSPRYLEGRVKLAKLDFLLRYPRHLRRILLTHNADPRRILEVGPDEAPFDTRMMRYRYGPWDPSYYAVLGSLIGRGLVQVAPLAGSRGFGYRTTQSGADLAAHLRTDESFARVVDRLSLLRRYLDKSGTTLKNYLYELPEVADATWYEDLT
jgi:hypothetical protein